MDVNSELSMGWSPLMLAGNLARADIFKLLVDRGANVNYHKGMYNNFSLIST
jgi:ankyrin repeat protein